MSRPRSRQHRLVPHRPSCLTCINFRMSSYATRPRSLSHWSEAGDVDPRLLEYEVQGEWWDVLAECGITLLVTREYEHLVMAMQADRPGFLFFASSSIGTGRRSRADDCAHRFNAQPESGF